MNIPLESPYFKKEVPFKLKSNTGYIINLEDEEDENGDSKTLPELKITFELNPEDLFKTFYDDLGTMMYTMPVPVDTAAMPNVTGANPDRKT